MGNTYTEKKSKNARKEVFYGKISGDHRSTRKGDIGFER